MNISHPFIARPIATALLMLALLASGVGAYTLLPIAAIPRVDFPTISVTATLPGAQPDVMAAAVAQPLERQFAVLPGVSQITSTSALGTTSITLQFALDRNIDGAAGDVQSAINAASGYLPTGMPSPPTFRKVNPADQPVIVLGMKSDVLTLTELDNYADVNIAQRLSMLPGVAQVNIGGEQKFAPTVQLNPMRMAGLGIGFDDVTTALSNNTLEQPLGTLQGPAQAYQLNANGQLFEPDQLNNIVVAYRNGSPIRISQIGDVIVGAENPLIASWVNHDRGLIISVQRQPDSNTIEVVDAIKKLLPTLQASIPPSVQFFMISDRSQTIRESVSDVKFTLLLTIGLVVLVVFAFLRKFWATVIPSITVPLSLIGTFGVMYVCGYSLDNLSLMGLTLAVGLVVDDAIVMIENIVRYIEEGESPMQAALKGSAEVGFTIISITISLIAVFIPLLFMTGIVGRLFREFSVVVAVAIVLSAMISLTLTPMMCALVLKSDEGREPNALFRWSERVLEGMVSTYKHLLTIVLRFRAIAALLVIGLLAVTVVLFITIPKGFFPNEDTGLLFAFSEAGQDVSFAGMYELQQKAADVILADPAIDSLGSFIGAGGSSAVANTGRMYISLKARDKRDVGVQQIIARLRPKLAQIPGITTYLQAVQSIQIGGRLSRTQYQYTLQDVDPSELAVWGPKLQEKLKTIPGVLDVATDEQSATPQLMLSINRDKAARLGVNPRSIESAIYNAYGRRFVTELYGPLNTYRILVEVQPQYQQDPSALGRLFVHSATGQQVYLSEFTEITTTNAPLSVNHQGQFPAITLSFNLQPGTSLGDAVSRIQQLEQEIGKPASVQTSFQGTAQAFQASLSTTPILIAVAIFAVYVILGILYESLIHPFTILLSLPPAGVGALLTLDLFGFDLSVIAIIGLIMLIGIVKKNAIMMIDFAIERRRHGESAEEAIFHAAVLRFRPIMMTSLAAILGTLPIAMGVGAGSELRQPLGVAVVGGLVVSQLLTLFTTPVTYLYMEGFSEWLGRLRKGRSTREPGRELIPAGHHPVPAVVSSQPAE